MEKLDFIQQFRAFIKLSAGRLDAKEQAVYLRLLGVWNELRRPEWFAVSRSQLMKELEIKHAHTITLAKNALVSKGFIEAQRNGKMGTMMYKLVPLARSKNDLRESNNDLVKGATRSKNDLEQVKKRPTARSKIDHIPESTKNKDYIAAAATRACAREGDQNLSEVVQTFSNNIHPVTGEIELGKLTSFLDDFGKDWTLAAITEAAENNGRSVRYIEAILERWKRDGFQSERRGEHGGARKHSAGTAGHSGESEKVRRRAEELAKFRAEYNAKIERERKAREAARSAESH